MTALPMVRRCAWAQWRGLTAAERAELAERSQLRWVGGGGDLQVPLWTVWHPLGSGVILLSLKDDLAGVGDRGGG